MGKLIDLDAIERVVADYYEAWFTGDAERMRASLHPILAKRAIDHPGRGDVDLDAISAEEMVLATAEGRGKKYAHGHQVQVLDIDGDLATVKAVTDPYVEYLHLARFGERWLIVNVLWRRRMDNAPAR